MRRTLPIFLVVSLLVLVLIESAGATPTIFVKIPGIPGDTTITGHIDEIAAESVQFGGGQIVPKNGPKACAKASPKTQLSRVTIEKKADKASPKLFLATAQATVFPEVIITITRSGADYQQYKLSDAFIHSYSTSSSEEASNEDLSFAYTSLTFTHIDPIDGPSSETWAFCGAP